MSAHSLRGLSDDLRNYLRDHKMPEVYEALLSGLCIMCPDDAIAFIINKLQYLQSAGLDDLQWDMFIDDDMKPVTMVTSDIAIDILFDFDSAFHPSQTDCTKAYQYYNDKLLRTCFNAFLSNWERKKKKNQTMVLRMELASFHYHQCKIGKYFRYWLNWKKAKKGRQDMAYQKIRRAHRLVFGRVIFEAWLNHTISAKKTREYFELLEKIEQAILDSSDEYQKLERGDNIDEDFDSQKGSEASTGEATDSLSALPKTVAVQIFSHLSVPDLARCAIVCRSWKILSQSSLLWSKINFSKVNHRSSDAIVHKILTQSRPYIVHLNLRGCTDCITCRVMVCLKECRNIQDLNLSECTSLTDDKFMLMHNGCKVLLRLNASHTPLGNASLRMIAQSFASLQFLSLAYCRSFTDLGLNYLVNGVCRRSLVYLDISGCTQLTPKGYKNVSKCENLDALILNDLETLCDASLEEVFSRCTKLTYVSLLNSPLLTDESFKRLSAQGCLQKIKIEANQKITDGTLRSIGKNCLQLTHVYVTDNQRITDISLKTLAICKHLVVINLADCLRISDTGVRYLAEGACGPILREINLTNCIRVGDIAIVNLHKKCPKLTHLTLCYCEHISEAGVELCGQMQSLVSLDISGCQCTDIGLSALGGDIRDLSISGCAAITDLGLQKFAQQSPTVEQLDFSFCHQLTDAAIKNLSFCCRLLSVLNLRGCKFLTDMSVQYLSGVCKYLSKIDLSGCILLTDKSTKYLKKGCQYLKFVSMLYCKGVTKAAISKLSQKVEAVEYNDLWTPSNFGLDTTS